MRGVHDVSLVGLRMAHARQAALNATAVSGITLNYCKFRNSGGAGLVFNTTGGAGEPRTFRAVEHGAERGYARRLPLLVVLRYARNIEEEVPVVEGVAKEEDGQEDEGSRELAPLAARRQRVVGWMHGG